MSIRARLNALIDSPRFQNTILVIIILNAVTLGLETSPSVMEAVGGLLLTLDRIFLVIFVLEIVIKLIAQGLGFFRRPWNLFDFAVVAVSLAPDSGGLSVLRALRILRVLRVISMAPRLRRVVEGFVSALPGMASVFLLMGIIFYIGAVMATKLFGGFCPACTPEQAAQFDDWFGTLGQSAYTLFQVMTLESWSMGIVRPVMDVYPLAWMFFVPFIMVTTFAVVNLLVGLIVNSMQDAHAEESNLATDTYREEVLDRLKMIEERLAQLDTPKT
ncbi:MAG: ion transporter [Pseudomonadota bacterium]